MIKKAALCGLMSIALDANSASPAEFDWSMLKGNWAESARNKFACASDNLHQELVVSTDHKTLTFVNDRKWRLDNGQETARYSATIIHSESNSMLIRYNADLKDIPDEYREWEMRFIGPGTYRWRSASWPVGRYNDVIGVKCP